MRYPKLVFVLLTAVAASLTAASLRPQPLHSQIPQPSQATRSCPAIDAGRAANLPPDPNWAPGLEEKSAKQKDYPKEGLDEQTFSSVVFSQDSRFLIAGTKYVGKQRNKYIDKYGNINRDRMNVDGTITVFTNLERERWKGGKLYESKRESTTVAVSSNGLLAGGDASGNIRLWRRNQWSKIQKTSPAAEASVQVSISSLAFSPDSRSLISAGLKGKRGGTLQRWDVSKSALQIRESFQMIKQFEVPEGTETQKVNSVAFSPNGKIIAATGISELFANTGEKNELKQVGRKPFIMFWNAQTGKYLCTINDSQFYAKSVAFSPDGLFFGAGGINGTIKLWSLQTFDSPKILLGHGTVVNSIAFSPGGKILVSGGSDRRVKLWRVETGQEIKSFEKNLKEVTSVAFRSDGKAFATGSMDGTIQLYIHREK
jgi:WD40 repeat protein